MAGNGAAWTRPNGMRDNVKRVTDSRRDLASMFVDSNDQCKIDPGVSRRSDLAFGAAAAQLALAEWRMAASSSAASASRSRGRTVSRWGGPPLP